MRMRSQLGFTLVELLLALGVSGLILPVIVTSIVQITRGTTEINNDLVVQQDIEAASLWLTRDLSLALTTDVVDGAPPVDHMRVDWIDQTGWAIEGSEAHYVEYTLVAPLLMRNYDGTFNIVARHVSSIAFSRIGTFTTVSITSTSNERTVSLSYFVDPRPEGAFQ